MTKQFSSLTLPVFAAPMFSAIKMGAGSGFKAWRDLLSAGQGVCAIRDIPTMGELLARMNREYDAATNRLRR